MKMAMRKMISCALGTLRCPVGGGGTRPSAAWTSYKAAGASAYQHGDYAEAERQFSAALKQADSAGSINRRAAASLNNLALVYKKQRKLGKAEVFFKRALSAYEVLEPGGAHVASVRYNLAGLYRAQGRYAEAAPLYKQAIATTEKVFGKNHPKLARRLQSYARLLEKMNRHAPAAEVQSRATAAVQ